MRNRYLFARIVFCVLPILSPTAYASDSAELLVPVDEGVQARLQEKSNYGLRGQLYFAKRYKIVEINFPLLDRPAAQFTITPFDDLEITVKNTRIGGASSSGQIREWAGQLVKPWVEGVVLDSKGSRVELPPTPVNFWVRSGPQEVPVKLIREMTARGEKVGSSALPDVSDAPRGPMGTRAFSKLPLTTLSGEFLVLARRARIVIQPIEDDPRYHLVYEADPEKIPRTSDTPSEETTRKLLAREEFIKALERERASEVEKGQR